jgi:hypothetical protein
VQSGTSCDFLLTQSCSVAATPNAAPERQKFLITLHQAMVAVLGDTLYTLSVCILNGAQAK